MDRVRVNTNPVTQRGRRKFLAECAAAAAGVTLLSGCPATPPTVPRSTTKPFQGQKLELVVPASLQLQGLWEVALTEWMDQTGGIISWSEYSGGAEAEASFASKLAAAIPPGGRVVLFPLPRLCEIDKSLAPISSSSNLDLKDLFRGLRERVVSRQRAPVAIPVSAPVLLCYYRADLLQKAGLNPPETWEDYQSLVETADQWAMGLSVVEPLAEEHRSTLLFARSIAFAKHPENYSVWFDLDSGQPLWQSPGFVYALELATSAWKKMPAEIATLTPTDCRKRVLEGKAALAIGVEPDVSPTSPELTRAESIQVGICRLPGSRRVYNPNSHRWDALPSIHAPGICGFSGLALGVELPDGVGEKAAAWHLLATLAGDQFETNWAALPKSPCRESQVATASNWHDTALTADEASQAVDAAAVTLRDTQLVVDLPIPMASDFRKLTDEVIGKILAGELEPQPAADQLQSGYEKLVRQYGAESVRNQYRRGLGLSTTKP